MNKQLVGLFAVAALVTGCATPYSEAPISSNFPTTKQLQLRTATHWTTIAQDVANQLISRLPEKAKVYVKAPAKNTPFERAFSSQLMTSLTNAGYAVMKYPRWRTVGRGGYSGGEVLVGAPPPSVRRCRYHARCRSLGHT